MMQLFGSQQPSLSLSNILCTYTYLYIFIIHIFLYVILVLYLTTTYSGTFSDCTFAYDCANNLKLDSKNEAVFQTHCESWHNGFFGYCMYSDISSQSRPWSFESTPYTSPISPSRSSCSLWFSPTPYFEANGNNGNPKVIAASMTFMTMVEGSFWSTTLWGNCHVDCVGFLVGWVSCCWMWCLGPTTWESASAWPWQAGPGWSKGVQMPSVLNSQIW